MKGQHLFCTATLATVCSLTTGFAEPSPYDEETSGNAPPSHTTTAVESTIVRPNPAYLIADAAEKEDPTWVSVKRGSDLPSMNDKERIDERSAVPEDRGVTIVIKSPASETPITTVTVSGYVKPVFFVDTYADLGDVADTAAIPIGGKNRTHVRFHAKETPVRVKSSTDTPIGAFRTWVEGDFYGSGVVSGEGGYNSAAAGQIVSESSSFRCVVALGEWDVTSHTTLGFGLWWSPWMAFGFTPASIDFTVPEGGHDLENTQFFVRYTSGTTQFTATLMNPETDLVTEDGFPLAESLVGGGAAPGAADKMPDIAVTLSHMGERFGGKICGVLRLLSVDPNMRGSVATARDNKLGWGVFCNLRCNPFKELTLFYSTMFGDGIGRYLYGNYFLSGTLNAAGNKIKTAFAWGMTGGLTWNIQPKWQFNTWLGGWTNGDTPKIAWIPETGFTAQANIIWKPVTCFQFALETKYIYSDHRAVNDRGARNGDNLRFTSSAGFFF